MAVFVDDRHWIVVSERLHTRKHLEHDDTQAVKIGARVDRLAVTLLRAHVVRRPKDESTVGQFEIHRRVLGQSEINQCDAAVVAQHDVAGLQITVQHPRRVDPLQGAGNGGGDPQRLARRKAAPHARAQVPGAEIFHDEVGMLVAHPEVV